MSAGLGALVTYIGFIGSEAQPAERSGDAVFVAELETVSAVGAEGLDPGGSPGVFDG